MHYRLYGLDDATGKIVNGSDLQAKTDEEAIRVGSETYPAHSFEIWCSARRVHTCRPQIRVVAEAIAR
jgi:hypothetical protein